jgi:pyruvate/2-oxoglutarate/acetoin dehydrogenase E1 component
MENEDRGEVENIRRAAWEAFTNPTRDECKEALALLDDLAAESLQKDEIQEIKNQLAALPHPLRRDTHSALHAAIRLTLDSNEKNREKLVEWKQNQDQLNRNRYSSHLYSQTDDAAIHVKAVKPIYTEKSPTLSAFDVLNAGFDAAFQREPRLVAFGEDVGQLGDVNQGFRGLQEKYGSLRIMDTGIREVTILGQAIGLAMRGLRPIAEIQYLDYLLYALQLMSDDLATLHWRTKGGQKAPVIVRTRGHRLEGIWHSGSLMAGVIHLVRGMHVLVPRNAVQAAGFYNTLLKSDEPGIIVEVLNAYRLKERLPDNIGEICVPLGVPEILRPGSDVTLVTYGAMCRIALDAADKLSQVGIETEIIDVQSLLPFDHQGLILESLKKTNRILFADEDVPGGTTATMLQEVIEKQGGYYWLDSPPKTLSAQPHRPAFGSDGDYWSKPNTEDIFDAVYEIMREAEPNSYPSIYE